METPYCCPMDQSESPGPTVCVAAPEADGTGIGPCADLESLAGAQDRRCPQAVPGLQVTGGNAVALTYCP